MNIAIGATKNEKDEAEQVVTRESDRVIKI
jgi:hypothetical protein